MTSVRPVRRSMQPLLVAWMLFGTYLLAARQVDNLFPLSVFDMYRAHAPEVVARVMVRDGSGHGLQLDRFEALTCEPEPIELATVEKRCGSDHRPLPYVLRDQQHWLDAHRDASADPGPTSEPVELVSRAYVLVQRPGAPAFSDCVIARCHARRHGGTP